MYKYYHVSVTGDLNEKEFEPRIPERALDEEEQSTPRVCASRSMKGAIQAFPDGYIFNTIRSLMSAFLYVYEIDALKIGCNNVKYCDQIIKYVPDAMKNEELWILKSFKATAKVYRFDQYDKYETEPTIGKEYTDIVVGKENLDKIKKQFKVHYTRNIYNCINYKAESFIVTYTADENTKYLWSLIANSHAKVYQPTEEAITCDSY